MNLTQKLEPLAVSFPVRVLCLVLGIAWLVPFGPTIVANLINPMVWYDAVIAAYFLVASIVSIIFFFSRRVFQLLLVAPALVYLLVGLLGLVV